MAAEVLRTGQPSRIESYEQAAGPIADSMRDQGVRSSIGSPVLVAGRTWGVMVAASYTSRAIPPGTETRLVDFTELAGTAVANAQSLAELNASRARIVASGDEARRHIERDLHDGLQQRLVSLALAARSAEGLAGNRHADLPDRLVLLREGLVGAIDELREISHGIHPAILSDGGLRPALARLARRSPVPVELEVDAPDRMPEPIEVCVYYVVSEALTNVAKHARATDVRVQLHADERAVRLDVADDGVGRVDAGRGSGLTGLSDRISAIGGTLEVDGRPGDGTALHVRLPLTAGV